MKRCKENCEGWKEKNRYPVALGTMDKVDYVVSLIGATHCPYCPAPLIDEPEIEMITRTIRVPKPMTERPKVGDGYFYINFSAESSWGGVVWRGAHVDEIRLSHGIYPTADLASMAAKAMIGEW